MKLQGKVAIVTGAASGMGKAIAEAYSKEGAKVVVSDLNLEGAQTVADAIKETGAEAIAVKTNVASEEDVKNLFEATKEAFGGLDILVNNAGIMDGVEAVGDVTDEKWELLFAVNTTAVMRTMRMATPIFLEQGHGVFINNISVGGLNGGRAGVAYTASKHAVVGITKNTAFMYAQKGIRCNGIAPGPVMTNIQSNAPKGNEFGTSRQMAGMGLMNGLGQPEQIASVAVFLGSDDASFVNGQVLSVDGAWTAY